MCLIRLTAAFLDLSHKTLSKRLGETAKAGGCAAEKEMVNRNVRTRSSLN